MANVVFSLRDDNHRIDTELTWEELAAIGMVTVLWAELEHALYHLALGIAEQIEVPIPIEVSALSFKKRIRATRALLKNSVADSEIKTKLLKTLSSISDMERSRNRITHGLWDWKPTDPAKTIASSARKPYSFEEHFDFKKLVRVAKMIGRLTFILSYPGGQDQAKQQHMAALVESGSYVSRSFALMLQGINPHSPHPFRDMPPQRKRTQRAKTKPPSP